MEVNPKVRHNFMAMLFLMANSIYAIGFAFFGNWSGVNNSSLYQSLDTLNKWAPEVWGAVVLTGSILCILDLHVGGYYTRTAGVLGFLGWVFASLVYLQTGYFMVFFSVGLLYVGFWAWFYFKFVSKVDANNLINKRS